MRWRLSDQTVLVTGATGFVGANLVRRLVALGCRPHVLVRPEASWWRLEDLRRELHVHLVDLSDAERLREIVAEVRPTIIYHLATYGAYPRKQPDVERALQTNVLGTWHLLRACLAVDFRLFVNMGTSSEYGQKMHPMSEEELLERIDEGVKFYGFQYGYVDPGSGKFMFKAQYGRMIKNGELGGYIRDVSLSGVSLEALKKVDGIGKNFGIAPGSCGKEGQWVPDGSGGPDIRVRGVVVGGLA